MSDFITELEQASEEWCRGFLAATGLFTGRWDLYEEERDRMLVLKAREMNNEG